MQLNRFANFFLNRGDGSASLSPLFMLLQSELCFKTWYVRILLNEPVDKECNGLIILYRIHLKDVILQGKDAFSSAHGMKLFEYIGSNEQFTEMFNRAMSKASIMIMKKILQVYRGFDDVNTLVDMVMLTHCSGGKEVFFAI